MTLDELIQELRPRLPENWKIESALEFCGVIEGHDYGWTSSLRVYPPQADFNYELLPLVDGRINVQANGFGVVTQRVPDLERFSADVYSVVAVILAHERRASIAPAN